MKMLTEAEVARIKEHARLAAEAFRQADRLLVVAMKGSTASYTVEALGHVREEVAAGLRHVEAIQPAEVPAATH